MFIIEVIFKMLEESYPSQVVDFRRYKADE